MNINNWDNDGNGQNNPFENWPNRIQREPNQALYVASLVLGITAIVTAVMMTVYIPFICGGVSIILAILSKGQFPSLHKQAKLGILLATIGIVLNIIVVSTSVYQVFTNPDLKKQLNDTFVTMYGESYDDMMNEIMSGLSEN